MPCSETKKNKLKKIAKEYTNLLYECRKSQRNPIMLDNLTRNPNTGRFEEMNDFKMSKLKSGDDRYEDKLKIRDEMDKARNIKRNAPRKMKTKRVTESSDEEEVIYKKCAFCKKEKSEDNFKIKNDGNVSKVCNSCLNSRKKNK